MIPKSISTLGSIALASLATAAYAQVTPDAAVPISVVPQIELVTIIVGAVFVGILINRVRQLEREVTDLKKWMFGSPHKRDTDRGET